MQCVIQNTGETPVKNEHDKCLNINMVSQPTIGCIITAFLKSVS